MCSPVGTECYHTLSLASSEFITPCHGLHADVEHDKGGGYAGDQSHQFRQALSEYALYKDGGDQWLSYPASLAGSMKYKSRKS